MYCVLTCNQCKRKISNSCSLRKRNLTNLINIKLNPFATTIFCHFMGLASRWALSCPSVHFFYNVNVCIYLIMFLCIDISTTNLLLQRCRSTTIFRGDIFPLQKRDMLNSISTPSPHLCGCFNSKRSYIVDFKIW